MQATLADAGPLRKQLTVSFTPEEVAVRREKVLKTLAAQVKLDGFRPGKSSKAVVEKRFAQAADQKAHEELADEGLNQALKEHQLKPIGPLSSDEIKRENGLTVVCSFDVKPAFALPEATALAIPHDEIAVGDQDVADALANLCRRAGTLGALGADETVAEDDSITLSGTVVVAGAEVRKLHDFHHLVGGYSLLGKQPQDVIGLFQGRTVGAEVRFTTTLPTSFSPPEAAGKEAEVAVAIQAAERQRPAAADDELAKRLGLESLAALKQRLLDQLKAAREQERHQRQIAALTDQLLAKTTLELPPRLCESVLKRNLETEMTEAATKGKTAEELDQLRAEVRANTEKGLKRFLILDALAEHFRVEVTREDVEGQIQMAAARSGRKPDEIANQLVKSGQVNQVAQEIREAKALEYLLAKVLGRPLEEDQHDHAAAGHAGHDHG